jgi:phytoene dehydrogenase-like protein
MPAARSPSYDAVVVGSGPNGLAAAITLAREGFSVKVYEARDTVGGAVRSGELTLPGFVHDLCSAIHPMAAGSPFLRSLPLERHGLRWIHPDAPLAHPLDGGAAAVLERDAEATGAALGADGAAYRRLMGPIADRWDALASDILRPLHLPRHPFALARFGLNAIRPAQGLALGAFEGDPARALFAGLAAHAMVPLDRPATAAFGLVLGALGHAVGWPMAAGGSQRLADALASHLLSLGGEIATGTPARSLRELPASRVTMLDVNPGQFEALADGRGGRFARKLARFRRGPGVFKADWALDGPIPWKARECLRAATVHVGGTLGEIAAAEAAPERGEVSRSPFVLVAQPSLFDPSRAPSGKHTAWAYCHVPNGCPADMLGPIEAQIERFAPGFRDRILARSTRTPAQLEDHNPNCVGGDISGGSNDLGQLFARPFFQWAPYTTPIDGVYLCSASTPPGGGVHGMCGHNAALAALRRHLKPAAAQDGRAQ